MSRRVLESRCNATQSEDKTWAEASLVKQLATAPACGRNIYAHAIAIPMTTIESPLLTSPTSCQSKSKARNGIYLYQACVLLVDPAGLVYSISKIRSDAHLCLQYDNALSNALNEVGRRHTSQRLQGPPPLAILSSNGGRSGASSSSGADIEKATRC